MIRLYFRVKEKGLYFIVQDICKILVSEGAEKLGQFLGNRRRCEHDLAYRNFFNSLNLWYFQCYLIDAIH